MPAPAGRSPSSGGAPLPKPVSSAISTSLGVDVSPVRVHTDSNAISGNQAFSSRAFAYGSDVFLGRGERPTDLPLMAHEVTHVVQQQGAPRVQLFTRGGTDAHEAEAQRASAAVVAGRPFTVRERSRPRIQRLGIKDALDYFADKANYIPGFRMFTIVIGINPINMSSVSRSAANIMRAIVEFIPGGALITQALDNYGVFDKVGNWVDQQIKSLGMTGAMFKKALDDFIDSLSWRDIFHLGDVWDRAKRIFTAPIDRLIAFAKNLVDGIIKFIKDAILKPLAKLAEGTRGWDLLIAVLGRNPITGEPVPRTAATLIPGFLKLIGQEQIWTNMQNANAIPRAWAWFQGALAGVMSFVSAIPTLFISALRSLEIADIVLLPRAFVKVGTVFAGFIGNFISWAGGMMWKLLEIIFQVVSPGAWSYLQKTGAALKSILRNPLPFVGNLVKAAKLGFTNFAGNFLEHLKAGLIDWLTGSLPGIYIPKGFSLQEIVKFVLSVLGISWANVRQKLVKVVGEPVVKAMETGFSIVVTLIRDGPAAAWEQIKSELGNLKDMVIGGITDFVVDTVVKKAVPKLISMFIPGAGFISAIISIYDTVMTFVQKISKIIQVVTGFIDSIVSIAAGVIGAAAKRVESTLAGLLSLAISFLAGFVGLGRVADKVMGVINKVRTPIDKALDALIAWIVKMAKSLFAKVFGNDKKDKDKKPEDLLPEQRLKAAVDEGDKLLANPEATPEVIKPKLPALQSKYKLKSLTLVIDADSEEEYKAHIHGEINPLVNGKQVTIPKSAKTTPIGEVDIGREKMRWLKDERVKIARKFIEQRAAEGKTSSSIVAAKTGKLLTEKKWGRRHIVSFADFSAHFKAAFPSKMTIAAAYALLLKLGKVDPPKKFTKKAIHSAIRSYVRKCFNDPGNVRIGEQSANSSLGAKVDPTDDMKKQGATIQSKLDAYVKTFIQTWCVVGVPFKLTAEDGKTVEWELTGTQ